jgi:hypothetical protein
MVGWLGRRAEPRVGFRREVHVSWPGQASGVVARAVNLSPTGILVDAPTPQPCPVGSPVWCNVPLLRGSLQLRGRVAHKRVLSPSQVGMGIAFTDLSPRMVAELRNVVDESEEKAQVVNLRFAGKSQLLCTRALPTAEGFQFTTALPFLRADTEVEIALSPDATLATKGWVSSVALDSAGEDGIPRLVIDIRAGESAAPRLAPDAAVSGEVESSQAPAPSLEVGAVPEVVQPWEVSPSLDAPADLPADPNLGPPDPLESAAGGASPRASRDPDKTEVVRFSDLAPPATGFGAAARSRTFAVAAASIALAAVAVVVSGRVGPPRPAAPTPVAAPVAVMQPPSAAATAPAEPPMAETPPVVEPIVQPIAKPTVEPIAKPDDGSSDGEPVPPADASSEFAVGLTGSLKGAHQYPLRAPDGVAFNLPNAHAARKVGTYRPAVPGLRAVWVRDLPGGGTHLRFYYAKSGPAPEVHLDADGVRAVAR